MKGIQTVISAFVLCLGAHAFANAKEQPATYTLLSTIDDQVVSARNEHVLRPIASISKLVFAKVLSEKKQETVINPNCMVSVQESDADQLKFTRSRIPVGTQISCQQALNIAMGSSENKLTEALWRTMGFISIKTNGIELAEPTGLNPENKATAVQLNELLTSLNEENHRLVFEASQTGVSESEFLCTTPTHECLVFNNTNKVQKMIPMSVSKTGYIKESGYNIAVQLKIEDKKANVIILGAPSKAKRDQLLVSEINKLVKKASLKESVKGLYEQQVQQANQWLQTRYQKAPKAPKRKFVSATGKCKKACKGKKQL